MVDLTMIGARGAAGQLRDEKTEHVYWCVHIHRFCVSASRYSDVNYIRFNDMF